jgi:mRNA-degrading endonuclease toxin of MazEF toxin-antitoxin module
VVKPPGPIRSPRRAADWLNRIARDVTVVPLTTVARMKFPTRVEILAGEAGLKQPSYAKCDQVTTIHKARLVRGPLTRKVSAMKRREIETAVRLAPAL